MTGKNMTEKEIREFLAALQAKNAAEANPARVLAWSGGISALKMVLGEND